MQTAIINNMKKTKEMNRTELVYELARHAHPSWYHSLLEWRTGQLRSLLAYYRSETGDTLPSGLGRIHRTKGLGDTPNPRPPLKIAVIVEIVPATLFHRSHLRVRQIGDHGAAQVVKLG
jgi:hypothetical protein